MKRPTQMPQQGGASLIEVLVAMLLVAFGIVAMGALQVNATRAAKASESRAMGALLVADLADRMRANMPAAIFRAAPGTAPTNLYRFVAEYPSDGDVRIPDPPQDCVSADCSAAQMAARDMTSWRRAVASALPGGWVRVSDVDPTDAGVDIWLMWVDVDRSYNGENNACPGNALPPPPPQPRPNTIDVSQLRCMYFRVNL